MPLRGIRKKVASEFSYLDVLLSDDGKTLIVEQDYYMGEDEKNSDDCCDEARENGELIVEKFPYLEIVEYYCYRSKYAIVELKCTHVEVMKQGDGFVYGVCKECGEDLY